MISNAGRCDRSALAAANVRHVASPQEALGQLARRGATIDASSVTSARGLVHRLWLQDGTGLHATVAADAFATLERDGAIVPLNGTQVCTISATGRLAVRRQMSRRGAPEVAVGAEEPATQPAAAPPADNPCESPLGWLRRRAGKDGKPLIGDAQFAAGERIRADIYFAGLGPRITTSWSAAAVPGGKAGGFAGGGVEQSDRAMAARERVNRALAAVGPELSGILIDVCGYLKGLEDVEDERGWAKRSAKVVLDLALTSLARHYGYIAVPVPEPKGPARVRHWASEDYRPGIEAWVK